MSKRKDMWGWRVQLGSVMGYPGVFQGNPYSWVWVRVLKTHGDSIKYIVYIVRFIYLQNIIIYNNEQAYTSLLC